MYIAEAAVECGLSIDTIRFYEKSDMLPPLGRDARGWRVFNAEALDWLQILGHLRKTGMPLDEIKAFASSAHGRDPDAPTARKLRLGLLQAHAARLVERRAELDACAAYLDRKITIYSEWKD